MAHRGYLGFQQYDYLAGYATGHRDSMKEQFPDISFDQMMPVDRMFYVAAFQAGIDQFVAPVSHDETEGLDFLKNRISPPKESDFQVLREINDVFQHFGRSEADKSDVHLVKIFLHNLICAMQSNAAVLSVVPVPDPACITDAFAPELAAPLIQLVAKLQPNAESVPVPIKTIDRANVERFQAIIISDAFQKYSQAHAELEQGDADTRTVLAIVRNSGNVLLQEGKRLLTPKPSVLHILHIVPKIVDTIFGKLPGALAQLAGNVAQDRIDQRKQVVIYQFDQWMAGYSAMQVKAAKSRNRS